MVSIIFVTSAVLAVVLTSVDAWSHEPLAEYLVKKFGDIMLVCVSTVGGLLAGQKLESDKR